MSEKERMAKDHTNNLLFYGVTTILILILFFLFVPKISSSLFPVKRHILWNNYISQVKQDGQINPQIYWEFREFFSPGYFTQNKAATPEEINTKLNGYGIPANKSFSTLLEFHAPKSESIDTLTTETNFKNVIRGISPKTILFQNDTSLIYKPDDHHAVITFLLPMSEMKKANGFFDYGEKDKNIVEGKYWFSILRISLP